MRLGVPEASARTAILGLLVTIALVVLGGCRIAQSSSRPEEEANGRVHSHPESPAIRHPEVSGMRVVTREEMDPPVAAYPFKLTDQYGNRVGLSDWQGRAVFVSFIYTNCSEACPLVARLYLAMQDRFAEAVDRDALELALVTTDPERDTVDKLRQYSEGLGGRWSFLTGTEEEMETVWAGFGVHREEQERLREVVVYHSYKTFLIDRAGNLRLVYTGVWNPDAVGADIETILGE